MTKSDNNDSPTASDSYPSPWQANYTLFILMLAYILSFIDRQILALLVGPIRADLEISDFQISLLQGLAFALLYTFLGIPIGRLADRKNRKIIISVGVFLWSIMTAVCGLAKTYSMLFLARIGVGIGEAALSPPAYSILSDSFPPHRLARATSIFTMGITIGVGIAYIVGGAVIELVSETEQIKVAFVGEVRPWQLAFFVVGLPGLLMGLLVLTIKEPLRRGLIKDDTHSVKTVVPIKTVFDFILQRWKCFGTIYASSAMLSIIGYGILNWYPTFLIRTYGAAVGEVGLYVGLLYLVFGTVGAISGALMSEYFSKKGYSDANLRVILLVTASLIIPAIFGPLMPTINLALIFAAPTVFLLNAHFGLSIAALQLVTPNQMRALASAILLFLNNLLGLGLGASFVAFFTDYVFGYDEALRYSLIVVAVIFCPITAIILKLGMKHYRIAMDEAESWR